MQKVNNRLNDERQRRLQFYNHATNRFIDESMKVEFINGEIIVQSPVVKRHNKITGLLHQPLNTYCYKNNLDFVGFEKIMTVFTRNDYERYADAVGTSISLNP